MIKNLINTGINGDQPSATVSRETPVYWIPLDRIQDNPYQPRQHYDAEHILNLALSIKQLKRELPATRGLQQLPLARLGTLTTDGEFDAIPRLLYGEPLELRRMVQGDVVAQLMFGHSRLRAWRVLCGGLSQFELLINQVDGRLGELGIDIDLLSVPDWQTQFAELMEPDQDYAAIPLQLGFALDIAMWQHAITENSQRKNINAIEEAQAMARAQAEFGLTDEEAGRPFGYARSTTANKMRLLKLPAEVQRDIAAGKLTERHGRELLRLADDPNQQKEAYKSAVKNGKTVAQLTDDVNWRAKQLAEKQHERQQAEAAQAILDSGWTPPGSSEPLPADRLHLDPYTVNFFDLNRGNDKALIEQGICGSYCECCVLAYNKWGHGVRTLCGPDAENLPKFGLACKDHHRQGKQRTKLEQAGTIQLTDAEREVAEEKARREAKIEELNRQALERWGAAMQKINRPELWSDLRFWQLILSHVTYNAWVFRDMGKEAQSVYELQGALLDHLFRSTKTYDRELNGHIYDMAEINKLITALAQRETSGRDKPAQPRPGDSQRTGWEDGWTEEDDAIFEDITGELTGEQCWTELPAILEEYGALPGRVLLRLIEECPDRAVRGQLWRWYNEMAAKAAGAALYEFEGEEEGVSRETVEEAE